MSPRKVNLDAQENLFFENELESITKDLDTLYPKAKFERLIPVGRQDPEGSTEVGYDMYDVKGMSKIIADDATDTPNIAVLGERTVVPVFSVANHIFWTYRDIKKSMMAGKGLETRLVTAAGNATERTHDEIAFAADGSAAYKKLYGLAYLPNITKKQAEAGATSGNVSWEDKTAEEIVDEVTALYNNIIKRTKEAIVPDTFAVDVFNHSILQTKKYGVDTTMTVKKWLEMTLEITIESSHWLGDLPTSPGTGAPGTFNAAVMYKKSPDHLEYRMPEDFNMLPPVNEGRGVRVETDSRTAGVVAYYPVGMTCLYGH